MQQATQCRGLTSSGTHSFVFGWVLSDISKDLLAFEDEGITLLRNTRQHSHPTPAESSTTNLAAQVAVTQSRDAGPLLAVTIRSSGPDQNQHNFCGLRHSTVVHCFCLPRKAIGSHELITLLCNPFCVRCLLHYRFLQYKIMSTCCSSFHDCNFDNIGFVQTTNTSVRRQTQHCGFLQRRSEDLPLTLRDASHCGYDLDSASNCTVANVWLILRKYSPSRNIVRTGPTASHALSLTDYFMQQNPS